MIAELQARRPGNWVFIVGRGRVLYSIKTCSGHHPGPYPTATGSYLPEGNTAEAWNWPLPSTYRRGASTVSHFFMVKGKIKLSLLTGRKGP
jgi:hypothetical protein